MARVSGVRVLSSRGGGGRKISGVDPKGRAIGVQGMIGPSPVSGGGSYVHPVTGKGVTVIPGGTPPPGFIRQVPWEAPSGRISPPPTGRMSVGFPGGKEIPKLGETPTAPIGRITPSWTGKVEQIGPEREVLGTTFIHEGEKVAEIRKEKGKPYAVISPGVKEAKFKFGEKEQVDITPGGIGMQSFGRTIDMKPSGAIVSEYKEPTKEELKERKFYSEMYGGKESRFGSWLKGKFSFLKPEEPSLTKVQQEAFGISYVTEPGVGMGGTMISIPTPEKGLSESSLLYKQTFQEELPQQIKFETQIKKERERILAEISPGGITEAEALKANIDLKKFYKEGVESYEIKAKERYKKREEKLFEVRHPYELKAREFVPTIPFLESYDPRKAEKLVWTGLQQDTTPLTGTTAFGIGIDSPKFRKYATTSIVGFGSLVKGGYIGIKERPLKTVGTLGAGIGITAATAGLGTAAIGGGYVSAATIGTAGRVIGGASLGLYGATAAARVAFTPGKYEKFSKAGEIISTEGIPFAVGAKGVGYGIRRYQAVATLKSYAKQLPPLKQEKFWSQMKEAKSKAHIQPEVKSLDLSRLELLQGKPKAQKAITDFFAGKKRIIVGGSIAQQTQVSGVKTKRPGDIDVYVKSIVGESFLGDLYVKDIAKILKRTGIKDVTAKKGKVKIGGEKLIEFHPYKTYLRYNIEQVLPWYKPAGRGITKTPEGVKVLRSGVQWQRKLVGGYLEPYISGKHRLKDIPAAMAIRESTLKVAQSKTMKTPKINILKDLSLTKGKRKVSAPKDISPIKRKDLKTPDALKLGGRIGEGGYYPSIKTTPFIAPSYSYKKKSTMPYTSIAKFPTGIPSKLLKTPPYKPIPITPKGILPYKSKKAFPYTQMRPSPKPPYKSFQEKITPIEPSKPLSLSLKRKTIPFKKTTGFYPEAKTVKTKKWKRLSRKPLSQSQALSRMSRAVDNSIAATGRIVPSKKKITPATSSYWFSTQHKFREGVIRKGRFKKTKNRFIEHRRNRLDTRGEQRGIKLGKFIKNMGWMKPIKKKPVKRKKAKGGKK